MPNEEYETKMDPRSLIKGIEAKGGKDPFSLAIQPEEDQYLPFFEDKVNVGRLLVHISSVTLVNTASVRRASKTYPTRSVLAKFRGTSDSRLLRRWNRSALSNNS